MNPLQRTFTFAGVAAVSALVAFGAWKSSQPSTVAGYSEIGQQFFEDFVDVSKATALTVVDYDSEEKDVQSFSVRQNDDGLWVIPSHHDYPAEAEDRLARTATSLLGVKKTAVMSRSKDEWKRNGVVDPSADGVATGEERGTRLTLSDGSGNALVDLIVGNKVEGQEKQYYVREPEQNTTYIAELDIDLSAKFSDWIEPDLLKINAGDVVSLTLDNYSIDEERGAVVPTEVLNFLKADLKTSGEWELADLNAETEEFEKTPVSAIATNLDQLKIVGVRKKPEGMDDNMRVNPAVKQVLQMQMQAQGYFIGGDKDGNERLYSNEGELVAGINNGVEYTLYFGEIARGSGKDIEVGLDADEGKSEEASEDETDFDGDENGPRRYLLVKAGFNESLLGAKPVAPTEPVKPEILNEAAPTEEAAKEEPKEEAAEEAAEESSEDEAAKEEEEESCDADEEEATDEPAKEEPKPATEEPKATDSEEKADAKEEPVKEEAKPEEEKPADSPEKKDDKPEEPKVDPKQVAQKAYDAAMATFTTAKNTYDTDLKAFEDKVKTGQEKAKELSTRFAGWYYVISSDSFEKFRVTRSDVVKEKKAEEAAAEDKKADDK